MQTVTKREVALCLTELHVSLKKLTRVIRFIIGKTNLGVIDMGQWLRACAALAEDLIFGS